MRDFTRPDFFGLVISMFTSFGYFDNKDEDVAVLRNIFTSLKRGGTCVIEVKGKEWIMRHLQHTSSERYPDGTLMVERHEIFDNCTRIRNEWILIRDGMAVSYPFHHTLYSAQELTDRLHLVGFGDVKVYGDLGGSAYCIESPRLVAVARKS